ncbi:MAG: ABC transporter substrate-binding protein [Deltaproteobacteria bacterium CG23_combo_of_CG06-09_8_20_14_all_51_20]|nr:ABC transporter substrate-binding protein [bacterium]NCP08279.1 ABC transporter substrate-binding protein [bacterium]PIP47173.1 MAG: ABC transporter substrate-binding protein [Deltaproteobacteria bacterium CG23_combo_of_CG06-09_8_20_14_all_51_20]PIY27220.1 MAG: ABC transporter substrate-binding protein [Deltaproteobacteria bacterium CG_4_10_14_3_um_filter_51_14]PJB34345.1 MAG: ABC transporter substrate-binding protein [Deltaproteobacteria bacterium CG_4_9_14_3_um_filter_51_14]
MKKIKMLMFLGVLTTVLAFGATALAKKIQWKLGSTWTPAINLYYGDKELIKYVGEMTGGNFEIKWFPSGTLMGAFEYFDGCSKGAVEAVGDWPSYWASKDPAFDFLGSFPFGFTNVDYVNWMYECGGLELMQELYGKYNMTYFSLGSTPMESGFRTTAKAGPIKTLEDYKGKKMRTPSRATIWILEQVGAAPVKLPGGEIYLAVERGTLDGAEFSSPGVDWEMGFAEITKYWSVPCWFQPASQLGMMVNLKAYNALSKEYQAILKYGAQAAAIKALAFYEVDSGRGVKRFLDKGTELSTLDDATLEKLEALAGQYAIMQAKETMGKGQPFYARILKSQMLYLKEYKIWRDMSGQFGQGRTPKYVDAVLAELDKLGVK